MIARIGPSILSLTSAFLGAFFSLTSVVLSLTSTFLSAFFSLTTPWAPIVVLRILTMDVAVVAHAYAVFQPTRVPPPCPRVKPLGRLALMGFSAVSSALLSTPSSSTRLFPIRSKTAQELASK
jgi:hypothetical protein